MKSRRLIFAFAAATTLALAACERTPTAGVQAPADARHDDAVAPPPDTTGRGGGAKGGGD